MMSRNRKVWKGYSITRSKEYHPLPALWCSILSSLKKVEVDLITVWILVDELFKTQKRTIPKIKVTPYNKLAHSHFYTTLRILALSIT